METRNLEKALEITACLIAGDEVSERGSNASLYQEYNTNAEVYDIVNLSLKKMNLKLYEFGNALYVSSGENNRLFGYTNEELRRELGVRQNKELYLAYFIIYNVLTTFYSSSDSYSYAEFVKLEEIIKNVDAAIVGLVDKRTGILLDEVAENSFQQIALSWDELPTTSVEDQTGMRAARNSKAGFVKLVFNFLITQDLFVQSQDCFYPTDRFKALAQNYFEDAKGHLLQVMKGDKQNNATD